MDVTLTSGMLLAPAACVTRTVCCATPVPVTVMVPSLAAPVLAVALILNEPLPVRLVGVMLSTVNHDVALLVGVFHVMLDVTFISALLAADAGLHEVGDTVRDSAAA